MMRVPPTGFLVPPESGRVNALRMLAKVTEIQSRGALFIYERTLQPGAAGTLAEQIVGTGENWLAGLSAAQLREVVALSEDAVPE